MPSLRYLGPTTEDIDVVSRLRLQTEIAGNVTPTLVDQQITAALADKANEYYLGDTSGQYVGASALDGRGDGLILKSSANRAHGPASLSGGRIQQGTSVLPNAYDRTGGRGWKRAAEYHSGNLSVTTGHYGSTVEQVIGNFTVNGPSYSWLPIIAGDFQIGPGKGEVLIKQGSRIIARAINGNDPNTRWNCPFIPFQPVAYTGSVSFSITRRAIFSPGETNIGTGFRITVLAVPA